MRTESGRFGFWALPLVRRNSTSRPPGLPFGQQLFIGTATHGDSISPSRPSGRQDELRRLIRDEVQTILRGGDRPADRDNDIPTAAREKLKVCLLDFLACAFEAHTLPWARQAQALATVGAGPCSIIGTSVKAPAIDAVFANSVAGHGLVREDAYRQRQPSWHRRSAASTCHCAAATGRWAQLRRGRHRRIRGRRPYRPRDCDAGIRPNPLSCRSSAGQG